MLDFDVKDLGFTEDDIADIKGNFEYTLNLEDWESITLLENDEELLRYLFIIDQDRDSLIDTILELSKVNESDLGEKQSVLEYMVDGNNTIFKLSNGRWAVFQYELIHKDELQQMD